MKPYPHQKEDLKTLKKLLKKHDHILFGAATGYGKSSIIYNMVKKVLKKGGRVLVIAPRRKLVRQLSDTLEVFYPSQIMGIDTNYDEYADLFNASTPTLHNKLKKNGIDYLGKLDLILVDEVHINFGSKSMSMVMELYWNTAKWVGLSATPIDDRGYRLEGWDHTHYKWQTQDLIEAGWLTPVKVMVEDRPQGLDDIKMTGGDYNDGDLADFMSDGARVSNVYKVWKKYAKKRRTMIFAVNINHANLIYEDFVKNNVAAAVVHSDIDEDEEDIALADFGNGHVDVIINVGKLTTGFDETSVDCLLISRPTKSLRLFLQIIGRGIRLHDGKDECLILDVAGTIAEHGYPTMRRDFNKVKPAPKEKKDIEFTETECDHCGYATQIKNCRREVKESSHATVTTWYCPNCEQVIKENLVDHREVERLKEVADYTNTKKVSNANISDFIHKIAEDKGYKQGWVNFIADDYRNYPEFKEFLKIQYNKYKAEMTSITTVLKNISQFRETLS